MPRLSHADTLVLLDSIKLLNSDCSAETLPNRTLQSVISVIPNEMTAFDGFGGEHEYSGSLWYSPPGTVSQESIQILGELIHEHPYFLHCMRTMHEETFRISDFVSLKKFQKTALFNEFYRQFEGDTQITSAMRVSPKNLVVLSMLRPKRDFNDQEFELLEMLTPHIAAAFRNAKAFDAVVVAKNGLARAATKGAIVLSGECKVLFLSDLAKLYLEKYFTDFLGNRLPDELMRSVREAKQQFQSADYYKPADPFVTRNLDGELRIRMLFDSNSNEITLVLEEVRELKACDFNSLGLTPKETEVLFWIHKGKTDATIGELCGISVRTVQKHTEHIFTKLGVESRTAAVIAALERIGR